MTRVNNCCSNSGQKNTKTEIKKPSCLQRISYKIISVLETAFYRLGKLVGSHPWKVIIISVLVTILICIAAPVTFTQSSDDDDTIWVPTTAKVLAYKSWVESNFPTTVRFGTMIFESSNVLTHKVVSAMLEIYKSSLSLTTGTNNFTTLCIKSGSNCLVNSILELWVYNETAIKFASPADIKAKINNATISPMYYNDYDVTSYLGGEVYDGNGNIDSAKATKMTWFIQGDGNVKEAKAWEKHIINLGLLGHADISTTYVYAVRSFQDESGSAISRDIVLLSSGYIIVVVYVTVMLGKFNCVEQKFGLAVVGIVVIALSTGICFTLGSIFGFEFAVIHLALPFLLLGVGVDDIMIIVGSMKNLSDELKKLPLPERIGLTMKHAGASITVTSLTDLMAFSIGSTTLLPVLRSFCVFAVFGILALYALSTTFFVAGMTIDVIRTEANFNSCLCCYKHKPGYKTNQCSQKELLATFVRKKYSPFLLKFPVKIGVLLVTFGCLGLTVWGASNLEQKFNRYWLIPSDSYASKYLAASDLYFNSGQETAAVYCKNIDYFNKKTEMDSLYTHFVNSQYVVNGTVDSWFKSYTDWLSTTSDASVITQLDEVTKYPLDSTKFYYLLHQFITVENSGKQFSSSVLFLNLSSVLSVKASKISLMHPSAEDSEEGINILDGIQSLVGGIMGTDCFPYSTIYLSWETNSVIRRELYRNLALAAASIFVICLILIANLWTSLIVFTCLLFTFVDTVGFMYLWGMTIEIVSSLQLLLCIGLAVDYSAHIGHCFMTFKGGRNERVKATLVEIGGSVFSGGFSTFLAIVLLAGSKSYGFSSFFKPLQYFATFNNRTANNLYELIIFLVVMFGLFHGLVYLPVLLGMIGPEPYLSADRRYVHEDANQAKDERKTTTERTPKQDTNADNTPMTKKFANRISVITLD